MLADSGRNREVALLGVGGLVLVLTYWGIGWLCMPGSRLYLLDYPNARSLHEIPTPRTGGLALLVSAAIGLIVATLWEFPTQAWWLSASQTSPTAGAWILAMTVLLAVVSFWDDRDGLPVLLRLAVQLIAAATVVIGAGVSLSSLSLPAVGSLSFEGVAVPLTLLFVLWMTNLYNFMDGMDGFAGGMTVFGFGAIAYFAWQAQHPFILILSLIISMGAVGFLLYNLPPARIFMGDVGSISLGFLSGTLSVLGVQDGLFDIWTPLLVFSPFVLDATTTMLGRAVRGEKIWEAHRTHYYQRLVLHGWGHRKTLLSEYALMALCVAAAVLYHGATDSGRLAILVVWILGFAGLAVGVGLMEQRAGQQGRMYED